MPEVLVRSLMSLYKGVMTRVEVDCELSEEFFRLLWRCTNDLRCHFFFLQWW